METTIASLLEQGIVSGSFVLLLYFFLTKFSNSLEAVSETLNNVSNTLIIMNLRMETMDARIAQLEKAKGGEDKSG